MAANLRKKSETTIIFVQLFIHDSIKNCTFAAIMAYFIVAVGI
jgi:hypothetical protein